MNESTLRQRLADAATRSVRLGLNQGSSGNLSLRCGAGFLITPSGLPTDGRAPGEMVFVDQDGQPEGDLKPSSEWRFHRDILRTRPEFGAVVHAHSPYAVSLACLRRGLPAFHYMVAVAGGRDIRCADYATFGSQTLSDHALAALEGRKACLLANHGLLAAGRDLDEAVHVALEVEALCGQFWRASLLGEPVLLSDAEMDEVLERFRSYGPRAARSSAG